MRYEIEPCFITSYSTSGDADSFDFQSQAKSEPSGGETIDATNDLFVDPLNPNVDLTGTLADEGHTGGANFAMGDGAMGDGSVRYLNPYVTVDYIESLG